MLTITQETSKKREQAKVLKDLSWRQPKVSTGVNDSTSIIFQHDTNEPDLVVMRFVDFQACRLRPQK